MYINRNEGNWESRKMEKKTGIKEDKEKQGIKEDENVQTVDGI